MTPLDRLRGLKLPFSELIGIEFTTAEKDRVVAELTVRPELCTNPAVIHGGAIMAFGDTLGAAGTILNLPMAPAPRRSKARPISSPARRWEPAGRRGDAGASRPPHPGLDDAHLHRRGQTRRHRDADANGARSKIVDYSN